MLLDRRGCCSAPSLRTGRGLPAAAKARPTVSGALGSTALGSRCSAPTRSSSAPRLRGVLRCREARKICVRPLDDDAAPAHFDRVRTHLSGQVVVRCSTKAAGGTVSVNRPACTLLCRSRNAALHIRPLTLVDACRSIETNSDADNLLWRKQAYLVVSGLDSVRDTSALTLGDGAVADDRQTA